MYCYVAYGLGIRSDLPLEELEPADIDADITIRICHDHAVVKRHLDGSRPYHISETQACFYWDDLGGILVRNGCEIVIAPRKGVDERLLSTLILGWTLALVLHQRKWLVLHASAVSIEGRAVLFLAPSGRGKSSCAAALMARGHSMLADDVAVINTEHEPFQVPPSFPSLKLMPDSAAALGLDPRGGKPVHLGSDKSFFSLSHSYQKGSVPLSRVYSLSAGATVKIERLKASAAVMELVKNTYHIGLDALATRGRHLVQCSDLARKVPVFRLTRSSELDSLSEIALRVEEDVTKTYEPRT
jgi:hypothetical protein